MNAKIVFVVLVFGIVAFVAGRSSLFRQTFLEQPNLVKEIRLGSSTAPLGEAALLSQDGSVKSVSAPAAVFCAFSTSEKPSHAKLLINEVAWMGNSESALNEWLELKNISSSSVDVSGWQILDKDEGTKFIFPSKTNVAAQGFYLLARKAEAVPVKADAIYAGNLKNADEGLRLFDSECNLIDEVLANPNWPAGENKTKRTMERASDFSWHTSAVSGGTPKAENSEPLHLNVVAQKQKEVTVSSTITTNYPLPTANLKILISEIMVGMDGNANYEFIELYNPNSEAVALTGWKITKKTSSGSESTLVAASRLEGKVIPAQKHFLLANQGGYNGAVLPDVLWPASYTLAYNNNAVVLYDSNGVRVEEISWSEIPKNQSFMRNSWDSSQFSVQVQPNPQNRDY